MSEQRVCPFRKRTEYDNTWTPKGHTTTATYETFDECLGDRCMMYLYDKFDDTGQCLLGRNIYDI